MATLKSEYNQFDNDWWKLLLLAAAIAFIIYMSK
jgi:hypothetical protein